MTAPRALGLSLLVLGACRTQLPDGTATDLAAPDFASCARTVSAPSTPGFITCGGSACVVGGTNGCCNLSSCAQGCRFQLLCDGPEDCAAPAVCCFHAVLFEASVAECLPSCGTAGVRLCHADADCRDVAGERCVTDAARVPSGLPAGVGSCQPCP